MYYWEHERRFNAYSNYFKKQFGHRLQKVTINAGFTCPNRDGTVATGGCAYCNNNAFNPSYCDPAKSVTWQIEEGIKFHINRYKKAKEYLAYFQAFSNTHAPIEVLKSVYDEALKYPEIVGLIIGTRPDCIDDEKLDYFRHLAKSKYVVIEYGLESCYNETLQAINRGHTFEQSVLALEKTASYGIHTGAHLIFGLPGESNEVMLKEAEILSKLPINTIKFHQLQIIKDTQFAKDYEIYPYKFHFFELEEYIDFLIDFIELLNPAFVIERFAGEVPPRFLAGKSWGLIRNEQIFVLVEKRLEERNTWQGKFY